MEVMRAELNQMYHLSAAIDNLAITVAASARSRMAIGTPAALVSLVHQMRSHMTTYLIDFCYFHVTYIAI